MFHFCLIGIYKNNSSVLHVAINVLLRIYMDHGKLQGVTFGLIQNNIRLTLAMMQERVKGTHRLIIVPYRKVAIEERENKRKLNFYIA